MSLLGLGFQTTSQQLIRVTAAKVSKLKLYIKFKMHLGLHPFLPRGKKPSDHYMKFSTVLFVFHLTLFCVKDTKPTLLGQSLGEPCPVAGGHMTLKTT